MDIQGVLPRGDHGWARRRGAEFVEESDFDIPVVVFNRSSKQQASVTIDNYAVGQSAAQHFLRRGHEGSPWWLHRLEPVAQPSRRGVPGLRIGRVEPRYSPQHGHRSWRDLLRRRRAGNAELFEGADHPTAVFVVNDTMIAGVMQTLAALGLSVPDDVEVVSFGDMPNNTVLRPMVTSFAAPTREMASDCARLLAESTAWRAGRPQCACSTPN